MIEVSERFDRCPNGCRVVGVGGVRDEATAVDGLCGLGLECGESGGIASNREYDMTVAGKEFGRRATDA